MACRFQAAQTLQAVNQSKPLQKGQDQRLKTPAKAAQRMTRVAEQAEPKSALSF